MALISNNSLIQPVYVASLSQMATVAKVAGRLYYIADANALWLCTDDAGNAPVYNNGIYTAGGGVWFGLSKGSALTGTIAIPANLGIAKPANVPIVHTSWLPGTVDEIVEVYIRRDVALTSPVLFTTDAAGLNVVAGSKARIYLVVGQAGLPPFTHDYSNKINHSFRYSGTTPENGQYVDLHSEQLSLDELTDVVVAGPTNGQSLVYNGTNWVNRKILGDEVLGISAATAGALVQRTGANTYSQIEFGAANTFLRSAGPGNALVWATAVTSVGLQMPSGFTVSNSPVTTSGNLVAAITGPITFANPATVGTPSIILGNIPGDDRASYWEFLTSGGFVVRNNTRYGEGQGTPTPAMVSQGDDYYYDTDGGNWWFSPDGSGSWSITTALTAGSTFPASPTNNQVFYKSGSDAGVYMFHQAGTFTVIDGSMYYNTTLNKVRLGKDGQYVSLVDEEDIVSLFWLVA